MSLTTRIATNILSTYVKASVLSQNTPRDVLSQSPVVDLADGILANQANRIWYDRRTLAGETSGDINVYQPVTRDSLGQTLTFAKIKYLYILNRSATAANILKVGGKGDGSAWTSPFDGSNAAKVIVGPGSKLEMLNPSLAGFAVVDADNHILKIENMGVTATVYDIILIGTNE